MGRDFFVSSRWPWLWKQEGGFHLEFDLPDVPMGWGEYPVTVPGVRLRVALQGGFFSRQIVNAYDAQCGQLLGRIYRAETFTLRDSLSLFDGDGKEIGGIWSVFLPEPAEGESISNRFARFFTQHRYRVRLRGEELAVTVDHPFFRTVRVFRGGEEILVLRKVVRSRPLEILRAVAAHLPLLHIVPGWVEGVRYRVESRWTSLQPTETVLLCLMIRQWVRQRRAGRR